jgi:hypothetical protein
MNEPIVCPVCKGRISDTLTAIRERVSGQLAHFDCILKLLRDERKLSGGDKIYYLGGGNFGVVSERRSRDRFDLIIRERIEYETGRRDSTADDADDADD